MGLFDATDRVFFAADAFGALLPGATECIDDVPAETLRDGLVGWSSVDAPWLAHMDRRTLGAMLGSLERLDPDPEYWEGKRGACVGVFQQVVAGKETPERLQEVVHLLRATSNPQVEYIVNRVMKKWAKENKVELH